MNIAVLVSCGGTNLQALIDFEKQNEACPYKIVVVMSDHKDAYAIKRAKNANIPVELVSPYAVMGAEVAKAASREEKRNSVSDKVLEYCKKYNVDAVVNGGWLTVLSSKIITEYEGRMINLHPALLPKFGGVGMWGHHVHEAVIAAKETESGCTVHFVDGGCDTGKIIVQKKVPVLEGDTPDSLYARITPEEHKAIVEGTCFLAEMLNK